MTDMSRLHRRLGTPPVTASQNLTAPEQAPVRIDGRTLRKTGRTIQFATRVDADLDMEIRRLAQEDGLKIVEVLERAIAMYGKSRG
jgi:hypothetical protein